MANIVSEMVTLSSQHTSRLAKQTLNAEFIFNITEIAMFVWPLTGCKTNKDNNAVAANVGLWTQKLTEQSRDKRV